ncbi:MAG TPA: hypothetical protein VMT76_12050 [Puia sp.]|nr:hypothetical protein [Puia sp.]
MISAISRMGTIIAIFLLIYYVVQKIYHSNANDPRLPIARGIAFRLQESKSTGYFL